MKRLSLNWWRLGLKQRDSLEQAFFRFVNLPLLGDIYHQLYKLQIKRRASRSLNEMEIETYNVCNLKCVMCPYPDMTREKKQMDMGLYEKIIDDAVSSGIRRVGLNFYSEPLLDPLIFKRVQYAKRKGLTVEFYSNGSLLTGDKIESMLDSGLDTVIFSFDGAIKSTYEKIRVGANFEDARNNIEALLERKKARGQPGPKIVVYLIVQRDNRDEVGEFKSYWEKIADAVWTGEVDARKTDTYRLNNNSTGKIRTKRLYPCKSVFKRLEVMSDGRVALCHLDYDGSMVLGDLTRQSINQVWNSPAYREIRKLQLEGKAHQIPICRDTGCQAPYWGAYCWWTWHQFK